MHETDCGAPLGASRPTLRIGIDAGSKTIKVVIAEEDGTILHSAYQRHQSNIRKTLQTVLHDLSWRHGNLEGTVAITGSAGISAAEVLGVPFVQEVVATTRAVRGAYPDADAVVELGGEDAKVIYLTGGLEQRMNATCAGGTGGFIDTIAFMLGVRTGAMSRLSMGASRLYPIASRCAVFAQTDVRPLLNAGAAKADIAASALDAVVRQTLGGLACGRPLRGTLVFLGGPFEYVPDLAHRFRRALGLTPATGILPRDAHLFTALGAALLSEEEAVTASLDELCERAGAGELIDAEEELGRLPALFADPEELAAFRERHARAVFPSLRSFDARGPLFLGVDAGSTTAKVALVDADGRLVYNAYEPTRGDVLDTVRQMVLGALASLPRSAPRGEEAPWIAHATATGYGEDLLRAALGIDSGVVETAAHLRGAQELVPDVSFVLDIGGQDMKALWVEQGAVADAVLNEACSSGCGAFIEGTAHSLRSTPSEFAAAALRADHPVDLGMRCTVFMSSRVKHAQKVGASLDDIAAGVAYSVVQNALFRIIGSERAASLGDRVVVQGGAFKSDAVLRAFELICGVEAVRCDRAHLMGAIGAALVARDRWEAEGDGRAGAGPASGEGADDGARARRRSTLIGRDELAALKPAHRALTCTGCANACSLDVVEFGEDRAFVSGNKCDRGADELRRRAAAEGAGDAGPADGGRESAPNLMALEQALVGRLGDEEGLGPRARMTIGIMDTLESYEALPFWHGLIRALGFSVRVPDHGSDQGGSRAACETVPSESVCFPAKLSHSRLFSLLGKDCDAVLMARYDRSYHCPVTCEYADALADGAGMGARGGRPPLIAPTLSRSKPRAIAASPEDRAALAACLDPLATAAGAPLAEGELEAALDAALAAQADFEHTMERAGEAALAWVEADPRRHAVLVAGRPYHNDAALAHDVDVMLQKMGLAVLNPLGLGARLRAVDGHAPGAQPWKPAKRLVRSARFALAHPQVDLVCLQSFGCGFDAVSLEEVRDLVTAAGAPFTALKVDEMVDTAHLRIRLRTLAETIAVRKRRGAASGGAVTGDAGAAGEAPTGVGDAEGAACAAGDAPGAPDAGEAAAACAGDAAATGDHEALLLARGLDEGDLEVARRCTAKDVCFTATALAARAIRLLEADPDLDAITLPAVCERCLVDAVPRMVERATGRTPAFTWERAWRAPDGAAPDDVPAPTPAGDDASRPRIGLVGNPLLIFDPFMNDRLVEMLGALDAEPVLPDPALLFSDDVRFLPQLDAFAAAGVRHVIYLQSFGCLKGHVRSRGALHDLGRRYPDMQITVLDYDPEASALNRENRVRLVVEAARRNLR
ncbi:BadF/BadG/BcrA/BcrD ATPase family protein [Adlercreutzia faecimuris]|uniref:Acyl-CoA dehydratase activase-related protein n=1 Tax=Adlercreutzia faecimuris TaxID=2897341 RepID=A0ABS9WK47_9ACTN|nr:BadF/BadG/BcrA/BcrD ATPase family protein [Adlercreutzia sp. JBNU-10]MCI2242752.1 acyl-CoA dehydratase activase-related protein [Adlercreutzia sp. JBNU-10]